MGGINDDRLLAVIYGLCLLLWIASGQIADPRTRRTARLGAWLLFAIGMVVAVIRVVMWLAVG